VSLFFVDGGVQFTYETDEPVKTVSLEVVWNDDFIIDDSYGITGEISSFHSGQTPRAVTFWQ